MSRKCFRRSRRPAAWRTFLRPHDVIGAGTGVLTGTVAAIRRKGGSRLVERDIGRRGERVDVELPLGFSATAGASLSVLPRQWKLCPDAV